MDYILSFKPDVTLHQPREGALQLTFHGGSMTVSTHSPSIIAALNTLAAHGDTRFNLTGPIIEEEGVTGGARFGLYLEKFFEAGILQHTLVDEQGLEQVTIVPMVPGFRFEPGASTLPSPLVMSRFAVLHHSEDGLIAESPLSQARVMFHDISATQQLMAFSEAHTLDDPRSTALADLFYAAGLLCLAEAEEASQWEFHDLLFHARSRLGRHDHPYGKVRSEGQPPVVKAYNGEIELPAPQELPQRAFGQVLAARESIRAHGTPAITRAQLGDFLHHSAHVLETFESEGFSYSRRPYPTGGATFELEIYPAVRRCEGLDEGLYHYDPLKHTLSRVAEPDGEFNLLLDSAERVGNMTTRAQILLVITARFQRVTWEYRSMAYALILKHVGGLYQTFYLTAAAMGLAPCALGGGDSDLFARVADLDYLEEASVGEFLLGTV